MSHELVIDVYNDRDLGRNTLSGDAIAWVLRPPTDMQRSPSKPILKKEGAVMSSKEKRINSVYNQILVLLVILTLFSLFSLISGKLVDRFSAAALLILSVSGFIAFSNDQDFWRKYSGQ